MQVDCRFWGIFVGPRPNLEHILDRHTNGPNENVLSLGPLGD